MYVRPAFFAAFAISIAVRPALSDSGGAARERTYLVQVKMLQGDPRGSLKAGTIKCLAEAALQTDGNEASYVSGSEHEFAGATVFVGLRIRAVVRPADQQRVHLKLKVERSVLMAPTGERALIQTDQVLFNERVTLDSKTKLTFGAPSDRPWMEVVVTEVGG